MDFQQHQEEAQQHTVRLVVLLVLGVLAIIAVVSTLLLAFFYRSNGEFQPVAALAITVPLTTVGVVGTSLVKSSQIRSGGGSYVAMSLGGRRVESDTIDNDERRLANVVEEIAIASGMPVPPVFFLDDEPGINAFAAGWSPDDAAIGVTRGALDHLNRRELQGVIAHEFSHIRNGDTRVKTRIIGWVFGITAITVVGRLLLQHVWYVPRRRSSKDNSANVLVLVGIGLMVVGALGTLFARLIQAAVSRQREFLADASAVQYTRDPSGIGEALLKIGSMGAANKVRAAHATETSHLFFSTALSAGFATHPPLKTRILRLLPHWDGTFGTLEPVEPSPVRPPGHVTHASGAAAAAFAGEPTPPSPPRAEGAVGFFERPALGGPNDAHIAHARTLIDQIPDTTLQRLRTPRGAVSAVIGALVSDEEPARADELARAEQTLTLQPGDLAAGSNLISDLERSLQLPAVDIALPAIQQLPAGFTSRLAAAIADIDRSHSERDVFRWVLRRVLLRHLADRAGQGATLPRASLGALSGEASTVLAVLAHANSSGPLHAQAAFDAGLVGLALPATSLPTGDRALFDSIDGALETLAGLGHAERERFVNAAAAVVLHDDRATTEEAELLRVVADAVRLPVPPLLRV